MQVNTNVVENVIAAVLDERREVPCNCVKAPVSTEKHPLDEESFFGNEAFILCSHAFNINLFNRKIK